MSFAGQTVHIPSAFSIVEILRSLHADVLRYPENRPDSPDRDYLVLSKGHGVMALYPILSARGWISSQDLETYFKDDSKLPGLYEAAIPGCEANTGSLGQGLGVAVGLGMAARIRGSGQISVCLVGDGELNEGSAYEALSLAGHLALENFMCVVDLNGFQAMGSTDSVISSRGLAGVFQGLGFEVVAVDGHNEDQLGEIFTKFRDSTSNKPLAVIASTTKGKGVSFMENRNEWHYTRLSTETFSAAKRELGAV